MVVGVFVGKGDTTDLEADAAGMQLETVFLEMAASMTEVANTDEHAMLHFMPCVLTPEALVTELIIRPVPRT